MPVPGPLPPAVPGLLPVVVPVVLAVPAVPLGEALGFGDESPAPASPGVGFGVAPAPPLLKYSPMLNSPTQTR